MNKSLQASEAKCLEVQEEFNRYRREQRNSTSSALHADIAKLKVRSSK
jgi:hypothetical protein